MRQTATLPTVRRLRQLYRAHWHRECPIASRPAPGKPCYGRLTIGRNAPSSNDNDQGAPQNSDIKRHRLIRNVPDIQFKLFLPTDRITAIDLRPAGDARAHIVSARMLSAVERQVL